MGESGYHLIGQVGNRGFLSIGVIGPGEGISLSVVQAVLKLRSVGPISGCVVCSLRVNLMSIHSRWESGSCANESSIVIQSLVDLCTCQSIILVR